MVSMFLGTVWFFLISMQTRVVAYNNAWWLIASCTFVTSVCWVVLVQHILTDTTIETIIFYSLGTSVGSVIATKTHARLNVQTPK